MFHLGLCYTLEQRPDLIGGASETIFPRTEAILTTSSRAQESLEFVASRKNMGRYRSVMDFFFCEMFVEHIPACMRFYDDKGQPFRDLFDEAVIAEYDWKLVKALEVAESLLKQKEENEWGWRRISWVVFRSKVLAAAA